LLPGAQRSFARGRHYVVAATYGAPAAWADA